MCENCDPEDLQPSQHGTNSNALSEQDSQDEVLFSLAIKLCFKLSFTLVLAIFVAFRIRGQSTSRPGPDGGESEATYPYTYDELDPEFDQYGHGIFFLPGSTGGNNIKNIALHQNFDASLPLLVRLHYALLAVYIVDIALLFYITITSRTLSHPSAGEWHHQRGESKSHSLQRKMQILLLALSLAILPATDLGLSAALVAAETALASGIRADPIITAYLEQILREYPEITSKDIETSLEHYVVSAWYLLSCSFFTAIVDLGVIMSVRSLVRLRRRRRGSIGSGSSKDTFLVSAGEAQVSEETEVGWEDTGPLARAFKRQLDDGEGGHVFLLTRSDAQELANVCDHRVSGSNDQNTGP